MKGILYRLTYRKITESEVNSCYCLIKYLIFGAGLLTMTNSISSVDPDLVVPDSDRRLVCKIFSSSGCQRTVAVSRPMSLEDF